MYAPLEKKEANVSSKIITQKKAYSNNDLGLINSTLEPTIQLVKIEETSYPNLREIKVAFKKNEEERAKLDDLLEKEYYKEEAVVLAKTNQAFNTLDNFIEEITSRFRESLEQPSFIDNTSENTTHAIASSTVLLDEESSKDNEWLYQQNLSNIDITSWEYEDKYIVQGGTNRRSGQASREMERRQEALRTQEQRPNDTDELHFLETPSWLLKKIPGRNGHFVFDIYTISVPAMLEDNELLCVNVAYKLSYYLTTKHSNEFSMTQYINHPRPEGDGIHSPVDLTDQDWNVDSRNIEARYGVDTDGNPESFGMAVGDYAIAVREERQKMQFGENTSSNRQPTYMVDTPQEYFQVGQRNLQNMFVVVKDEHGTILDRIHFGYVFDGNNPIVMVPQIVDGTDEYFERVRKKSDQLFLRQE